MHVFDAWLAADGIGGWWMAVASGRTLLERNRTHFVQNVSEYIGPHDSAIMNTYSTRTSIRLCNAIKQKSVIDLIPVGNRWVRGGWYETCVRGGGKSYQLTAIWVSWVSIYPAACVPFLTYVSHGMDDDWKN